MKIILDMDECLSDFKGGACRLHGVAKEEYMRSAPPLVWEAYTYLGLTVDDFWNPIHQQGERFWENLERLPWCHELVKLVNEVSKGNWIIATSPSRDPYCFSGKVKWLKRVFGNHFDRFSIGSHKHFYAQKGSILIDDREANCEKFIEHGGDAILFPSHGNIAYRQREDPMPVVRQAFKEMGVL